MGRPVCHLASGLQMRGIELGREESAAPSSATMRISPRAMAASVERGAWPHNQVPGAAPGGSRQRPATGFASYPSPKSDRRSFRINNAVACWTLLYRWRCSPRQAGNYLDRAIIGAHRLAIIAQSMAGRRPVGNQLTCRAQDSTGPRALASDQFHLRPERVVGHRSHCRNHWLRTRLPAPVDKRGLSTGNCLDLLDHYRPPLTPAHPI
jgi:hypothetical protein